MKRCGWQTSSRLVSCGGFRELLPIHGDALATPHDAHGKRADASPCPPPAFTITRRSVAESLAAAPRIMAIMRDASEGHAACSDGRSIALASRAPAAR